MIIFKYLIDGRFKVLPVYIFEIITFLERLLFVDESIEIKIFLG